MADSDHRQLKVYLSDLVELRRKRAALKEQVTHLAQMHLEFVEPSKRYADVIIPEGGHNVAALDMVVARIETLLK